MIPAVVSVNVVQDVKVSGAPFGMVPGGPGGGDDDNGGGDDNGPGAGPGAGNGGGGNTPSMPGDPFYQLRRYFGQGGQRGYKQNGAGSGVFLSAHGHIPTPTSPSW